jgi:hypothetical protein
MQQSRFPPLVEAFLIVEQPRQRLSHWAKALAPLDDDRAPPLAMVTAYYDPSCDQALVGLRYDELALGRERLAFVVEIALLAEIGMIQPAELSDGDRRRFLGERLTRCTLHVVDQRNVVAALTELVRRIRDLRLAPREHVKAGPIRAPGAPPVPIQPRGTTENPVLLVHPKGTHNDVARSRLASASPPPIPRAPRRSDLHTPSPHILPRVHHAETVQMSPIEAQRMAAQLLPAPAPQRVEASSSGLPPAEPPSNEIIYARYLRSGRWVPIRIGALSLKGASLMAGALPRLNDHVDVALSYADHRALVRGPVKKVSTLEEAATSGAAGFSVSFELDDASRRQLTKLLTAARDAQVTIKPPPPRQARRFPVEWTVCLGTMRGAVRAEALDVSREGMFVKPVHALAIDSSVNFSTVLDDGGVAISGRAKVVREIDEVKARDFGLAPGYGLRVVDMAEADHARWMSFLQRIEQRADKRVLIGAAPSRLAELQTGLAAAGYAVTGGTDPGSLVQLASAEIRPVDAVLIDAGWITPGMSAAWIESLFSARNVPCLMIHGEARRARAAIDNLLAIA